MAYQKQNFENGQVLNAEMLSSLEQGILDNESNLNLLLSNDFVGEGSYNIVFYKKGDKIIPIWRPADVQLNYYFYDVIEKGLLSPNNMYQRKYLYSQSGQDGTIYKGLSFRGGGGGSVTIKNVDTGASIGTMSWDKADLLKPHDNSITLNVEYGLDIPIETTWTTGKTYGASNGQETNGNRAICPKISIKEYQNIKISVSSCRFIVCCYDKNNTYLGQITPDFSGMISGTGQWITAGSTVTEQVILSLAPTTHYIGICVEEPKIPTYTFTYSNEECFMYSNIYNTYATASDRHIGECCVYKVYEENEVWSNNLKQLIKIGFINDSTKWSPASEPRPYGNFAVDAENKYLYAFTMYSSKGLTYWHKFNLPKVTDGVWNDTYGCYVCTLNVEDILDSWTTPLQNYVQGACVHKGLIYSTEGFNGLTPPNLARLRIIDPVRKEEVAVFHFYSDDDPVEPEMIEFYNGICYYGSVQKMYTLEFV